MKVQGLNSSAHKTQKAIKTAFAELINEKKDLNKLTVTELVKRANITRSTFYTHYSNIYEVSSDYQLETIELLISDEKILYNKTDILNYFDDIFECLKMNEKIYKMLLASNDSIFFLEKLQKMATKKIYSALQNSEKNNQYLELDVCFFMDAIILELLRYFKNESNYSLDELLFNTKKWFEKIFN